MRIIRPWAEIKRLEAELEKYKQTVLVAQDALLRMQGTANRAQVELGKMKALSQGALAAQQEVDALEKQLGRRQQKFREEKVASKQREFLLAKEIKALKKELRAERKQSKLRRKEAEQIDQAQHLLSYLGM